MLGVTPPISTDPPKPADIQSSEGELLLTIGSSGSELTFPSALMSDLVALNQFESEQERKVR
jgi:poly(A) polymerase